MKRRLLIIVLALALAAVGTAGVLAYVKRANARALAGMRAVSVLVAQKSIPSGTTAEAALRDGSLASQDFPASSVPAGALGSIPPDLSALVFGADLQPGQLLLRPMLVTEAHTTSGLAIPAGMMAVTVNFCLPEVVAGAVQPGSLVAVFDTISSSGGLTATAGCAGQHAQASGLVRTRLVLNRVLVLSVGAAAGGQAGSTSTTTLGGGSSSSGQGGTMVTLAVTQAGAERLIQLTERGLPYLALLTPTSRTTVNVGPIVYHLPAPKPSPSLTFPVITPSPAPTQLAAPSPFPTPSPA